MGTDKNLSEFSDLTDSGVGYVVKFSFVLQQDAICAIQSMVALGNSVGRFIVRALAQLVSFWVNYAASGGVFTRGLRLE